MSYQQQLLPSSRQAGIGQGIGQQPQFGQFQQPGVGQPQFQQQPSAIAAQGSQPTQGASSQQTSQPPQQVTSTPQQSSYGVPQQSGYGVPQQTSYGVAGTTQQGLGQAIPQYQQPIVQPTQQYGQLQSPQAGQLQPKQTGQVQSPQTGQLGAKQPVITSPVLPQGQSFPQTQTAQAQVPQTGAQVQQTGGQQKTGGQQMPQQAQLGMQAGQSVGLAASPSGQPSAGQSLQQGAESFVAQTQGVGTGSVQQVGEQAHQEFAGTPSIDMMDTPDEIILFVDLPGFEEEDIRIQADGQNLTVSAERRDEEREEGQKLARERPLKLRRTVRLPTRANVNEADAAFENGVCKIVLPKMEEEKQHEIAFQ